MDHLKLRNLLKAYREGRTTEQENNLLEDWYVSEGYRTKELEGEIDYAATQQRIWERLAAQQEGITVKPKVIRLWPRIAVAAAVAIIIFGAGLFIYQNEQKAVSTTGKSVAQDIAPGKLGATLTLANGKTIRLSDAASGEIAKEAGVTISKTVDGQVVYEMKADVADPNTINTLTTARGETYILTLPDHSKVWLNAASSLTYTAALKERGVRRVRLSGEAYFEVAKDKAHPFVVDSRGQQVEVLGTHFNVSSYNDDADIKTTLLEGSVKVKTPFAGEILKPGEQSVMADGRIAVSSVDAEEAMAWKNGDIVLSADIRTIMKQLARWYDIEVVYSGKVSDEEFLGTMSRNKNISEILYVLESTKRVHFKLEGRRITVMP